MVLLNDLVNGGNDDGVNSLEDYLVFNYLGLNSPQKDGIIVSHQGSLLLSCEKSPPSSNRGTPLSSAKMKLTITDLWSSITVVKTTLRTKWRFSLYAPQHYMYHSNNKAYYPFFLLKVQTMDATV